MCISVLMSIKPKFAEEIFKGTKQYEFRRSIFKSREVKRIVVYASSPVQKVIGEFEVEDILSLEINELWNHTKEASGIDKEAFEQYFKGKSVGYAIKIKRTKRYTPARDLKKDYSIQSPPQSFLYLKDDKF